MYEVINMLINSIVGILSQCIQILKYFVRFRYIINLFVSHITLQLKKQTDTVHKRGVEECFLINASLEGYSTVCLCLPITILKLDFDTSENGFDHFRSL